MSNHIKRITALALSLLMVFSVMPLDVLAAIIKTEYSSSVSVTKAITPEVDTHTYNFYDGSLVQTQIIQNNETLFEPPMPSKIPGKIFEGWFIGGTQLTFGPKTVGSTETFDVNARFRDGYYVYFVYNGNVIATKEVAPNGYTDDSGVSYIITDPTLTFSHWSKNGNIFSFGTAINEDTTLILQTRIGYKVTFNSQGGSAVLPAYTNPNGTVSAPVNPARVGYPEFDTCKNEKAA